MDIQPVGKMFFVKKPNKIIREERRPEHRELKKQQDEEEKKEPVQHIDEIA